MQYLSNSPVYILFCHRPHHPKQIYTFASHHCILLALYFPFHIGQFYIITKLF